MPTGSPREDSPPAEPWSRGSRDIDAVVSAAAETARGDTGRMTRRAAPSAPEVQPDIATVAAHLADRSRARMLMELIDGTDRPASHLARVAGVAASTASGHLARLVDAGFVDVEDSGRHRRFRITDPRVFVALEALIPLAETPRPSSLATHTRFERLRVARTCYDHLAGALGTDVLDGLLERGALVRTDGLEGGVRGLGDAPSAPLPRAPYAPGPAAEEVFGVLGVSVDEVLAARRPAIRACVDWTEQRHHLAGGLGAATLRAFEARGWVERRAGRRDLRVAAPERIAEWLGRVS